MTRVLCLHGLGGTGATMWPIVAACIDAGFTTLAPTLPGHGTDPTELCGLTWTDWLDAAREWEADVVVGQSMGACLALQLAAERRCRAVVCINPIAADPDAIEGLMWRKRRGQAWIEVAASGVDEIAYERLPIEALIAMTEGIATIDVASIHRPALLVTSANDEVVDPASSDVIAGALRGDVRRLYLRHSGHVATLDQERHLLQRAIVDFVSAQNLSDSTGSRPTRDQ
jgi:carboxylesterase